MASKRNRDYTRWNQLYKHINTNNTCIYCGLPAVTFDHVPPISRVDDYRAMQLESEVYLLVPSCNQCNSLLSNSLQENIICRMDTLKIKLKRKLNKHIMDIEWTDSEIAALGPNLKTTIKKAIAMHRLAQQRLTYEPDILDLMKYI